MNLKKILSALISGALVVSTLSVPAFAGKLTLEGEGTEEKPYLISSVDDLKAFRDSVDEQAADGSTQYAGKYFKLTTNIDLTGENWNPIGSMEGDHGSFKGVFDGDGHTISNLNIEQAGSGLGFFAYTTGNAEIKNLNFENVTVKSTDNSNYVAGVVADAFADTKITNVNVTGKIDISGRGYIGGIVGHGFVVLDKCSVKAEGTIHSEFWCAGGLVGYAGEGTSNVTNSSVEGTGETGLVIESAAGGLGAIVGMAEDNDGTQPISGSNLSAKNVEIKTFKGAYGDAYATYALGYLYGGNPTSILTGNNTVEDVTFDAQGNTNPPVNDAVAKIDDKIYATLAEALNAAQAGAVIELYKDIDNVPTINKPVTIKGYSETDYIEVNAAIAENFPDVNGTVTFQYITFNDRISTENASNSQENLTLKFINCDFNIPAGNTYAIQGGASWNNDVLGELYIEKCNFKTLATSFVKGYMAYAQCVNSVTIKESVFDGNEVYCGAIHTGDSTGYATAATISGNTFKNFARGIQVGNRVEGSAINIDDNNFDNIGAIDGETEAAPVYIHEVANAANAEIDFTNNDVINGDNINFIIMDSEETNETINAFLEKYSNNTVDGRIVNIDSDDNFYVAPIVAKINGTDYVALQDAIDAAKPGETIVLQSDVAENVVVGGETPALMAATDGITLDLNGKTLTAEDITAPTITNKDELTITNGTVEGKVAIRNEGTLTIDGITANGGANYAVQNWDGNMTIEDITVNGVFGALGVYGGEVVINDGDFTTTGIADNSSHLIWASKGKLTIKDGTYTHLGQGADGSIIYISTANMTVNIDGGEFETVGTAYGIALRGNLNITGGFFKTGEIKEWGGTASVTGGFYKVAPTANVLEDGYKAIDYDNDVYGYKVVKEANEEIAGISVYFRPKTSEVASEKVYEIVLKAAEGQEIYEWATADLTFLPELEDVAYSIEAADAITLTKEGDHRYMFNMDGENEYEITDDEIVIGEVTFAGYGEINFSVDTVDTNVVMATEVADSIAKEFTVDGKNKLTIDADDIGTDTDDIADDLYGKIVGEKIEIPTQKLTINVAFPNKINDNKASYQAMTVTISGGDLEEDKVIKLGTTADLTNTKAVVAWDDTTKTYEIVVADELTTDRTYNVTVSGEGYRTARYAVKMDAEKTLNFWNNVKDVAEKVEEGNEDSKENVTFLAGEIVKDNVINVYDLSAVVSYFGSASDENNGLVEYDLNRDNNIDSRDVAYVLVSWGK